MRIASLSLLIYISFFASTVFAQDTTTVNRIESEINAKQTEYTRSTTMLDKYLKEENQLQTQLELLRTRSTQLDKEKTQALDAMNDMYRRFIDNPSLYITSAQSRYQKAVVDQKQNKNDIFMQLAAIASI
jgi:predicted transcriptional regulator